MTTQEPVIRLIETPVEQCRLVINENFTLYFARPMPNRWWRFWQRALLGWKWEPLP